MRICPTCGACTDDVYDLCAFDGALLEAAFAGPRVLSDRYLLEQRVAAGAMGVVFRALHLQIGSTVAVKLMQPESEELQVGLARFWREAQILGQIKHPNAVLVMDFGVENREPLAVPYLVTEFLRGEPLSDRLGQQPRFSLEDTERVIGPVCEAVEEAHQVGVIHRDLKPSNIFLERLRDGTEVVKVLDFGIAKFVELVPEVLNRLKQDHAGWAENYQAAQQVDLLDEVVGVRSSDPGATLPDRRARPGSSGETERAHDATLTEAGFMVGTIPFMAPEQMTGERVSRQTDVYALASVTFTLLTGRLPFEGSDDEIINAKISDERPSLRAAGLEGLDELDELLGRCFALEPAERPASVLELSAALRQALGPQSEAEGAALALSVQLGAVAQAFRHTGRAVHAFAEAAHGRAQAVEEGYQAARDRLLSLDHPLGRALRLVDVLPEDLGGEEPTLLEALSAFETELDELTLAIRRLSQAQQDEYAEYLAAIWHRSHGVGTRLAASLAERLRRPVEAPAPPPAPPPLRDPFRAGPADDDEELAGLIAGLVEGDPLSAEEAFDALLGNKLPQAFGMLSRALPGRSDPLTCDLVRGLWRFADRLLLHELYARSHAFRLLPTLTELPLEEARPFARLQSVFSGVPVGPDTARLVVESGLGALDSDEDRRILWRCLLAHPLHTVRLAAAEQCSLSDFWNVVTFPRIPVPMVRAIFEHVADRARPEYLKVFFLLVRDRLASAATAEDVEEAFLVLQRMFTISCFHEDVVFEPLLDTDRALRQQVLELRLGEPPDAYAERLASFTAEGVVETVPPESMRDVPLPIQRRLARDGHFLSYFVCHANERVARETLPHLFRKEDIIRFLRLPQIHRAVLVELARERRFFRKEAARLALLQNPKTPANVARIYLPLLPHEQVRLLSDNKHISVEVRRLAQGFLEKLATRSS